MTATSPIMSPTARRSGFRREEGEGDDLGEGPADPGGREGFMVIHETAAGMPPIFTASPPETEESGQCRRAGRPERRPVP